jgi:hypothetical protein
MSDLDIKKLEKNLQSMRPARPPDRLLERVVQELSSNGLKSHPSHQARATATWGWLRWFAPAACAMIILGLLTVDHPKTDSPHVPAIEIPSPPAATLKADKIEIERKLVADYDAIGRMPNGRPVRFRCEQWTDRVKVRDSAAGLVVERTIPRLEIVPVNFEVY